MGVPKFFRYISERYPCLSELAREQSIPEFDNLYLDMNGIIHNCSHPDDNNIHFNISEEQMFKDICNYIDKLFFLIKPQKLFFMAIDGVAPRAKMNQQRSRRFRSAKDAELLEAQALRRGEVRETERFDSNCITPGTEFMVRLHSALRYFVKTKMSTDPNWQKCRIILSGHDCPGEGEHKIMDYIRYLKSLQDYDPNTRHCLYGLDADLIILGLCTHELNFVVLREEVKFGKQSKRDSVEETRFFLLHLGLMREYLELEFDCLRQNNPDFDIANLVDDWVLIGFMVGNDFIPHLPCLHISSNALPLLYKTYMKVYPSLGGNINVQGVLNLERLEKFFEALTEVEMQLFQEHYADLKYFEAKQSSKNGLDETFNFDVDKVFNDSVDTALDDFIESTRQCLQDDDYESGDEATYIVDEFETYKRNYYVTKLNQDTESSKYKHDQAVCYITALQWILHYYYRGVQSWDWYYPHHYAPFISDLKNFRDHQFKFNMGTPFLPFQQLLAVLPAASKNLLPLAYQDLMTNANSSVIHFYPNEFETDLNGKKNEWEAVVLIPFIDEKLLLTAMNECEGKLTAQEVKRNQHGPLIQYDYTTESQGPVHNTSLSKTLYNVFCKEKPVWSKELTVPADRTVCVELPNAARDVFFPGFPTMKHLEFTFELRKARVKVFDYPSRNENMILKLKNKTEFDNCEIVALKYLNQTVFIGWPHLIKGLVVAVSDEHKYIDCEGIRDNDTRSHGANIRTVHEHLLNRMGIELSEYKVLVHVRTYSGTTYQCGTQGKVTQKDLWSEVMIAYPAHAIVAEISVQNAVLKQHRRIEELFPVNSPIFFVGNPYYGSEGTILDPMLVYDCGRLKVNIMVLNEPDFTEARQIQRQLSYDYISSQQASSVLNMHERCLGRLTGSVLVISGMRRPEWGENISRTNVGLQLKFPKNHEERAGYARRINRQWYYSSKAIALIQRFCMAFPMIVQYIARGSDFGEFFFEGDFFPLEIGQGRVEQVANWLKAEAHSNAEKVACGSQTMEKEAVEMILNSIEALKLLPAKTVKLQVKPHLLLKPDVTLPSTYKSKRLVRLFDRVVIVRTTYMVPLGAKGTVVGIYPVSDPNPVRLECVRAVENFFEILFDNPLPNGHSVHGIAEDRVYKVPESSVLLIFTQAESKHEIQNFKPTQMLQQRDPLSTADVPTTSTGNKTTNIDIDIKNCNNNSNTQLQNSVSVMPTISPNLKSNSFQLPLSSANKPFKENIALTQPIMQKGGEDFWMPAANTRDKDTRNAHRMESQSSLRKNRNHSAPMNIVPAQPPINAPIKNDFQKETRILRNLLGLGVPHIGSDSSIVHQLPQPPSCWRADAMNGRNTKNKEKGENNNVVNDVNNPSCHQASQRMKHNQRPHQAYTSDQSFIEPINTSIYMQSSNPPDMNAAYVRPLFAMQDYPQRTPISINHEIEPRPEMNNIFANPAKLNQSVAFLPVQVVHNNWPPNKENNLQPQQNYPQNLQQNFENLSLNVAQQAPNIVPTPSKILSVQPQEVVSESIKSAATVISSNANKKPPPRMSKIAARFDNATYTN